jgi:hypothetical protein
MNEEQVTFVLKVLLKNKGFYAPSFGIDNSMLRVEMEPKEFLASIRELADLDLVTYEYDRLGGPIYNINKNGLAKAQKYGLFIRNMKHRN